jgi:manganese/zinc/iron transport system permease protein
MNWTFTDTWIVITGMLCAVACALPGCFLVLRRMSMMGDAISHAVLPGLAIAFMITGARESVPMFLGAVATGVFTALFTQWIHRFANVDQGAAMGVVFTTLFAVGLLLIVAAADHVDLDPGCVLYGAIETSAPVVPGEFPRAAAVLGAVVVLNLLVIALFYKELRLSSFDPALADTLGFRPGLMHYLLMTLVAITTVAAFESVGSIIVIAMLIVPAATAQLLTKRLLPMLFTASITGALAALLGHVGAITVPMWLGFQGSSTSGMMAAACGLLFALAWLFAPGEGLVTRWRKSANQAPTPPELRKDPGIPGESLH